MIRIILLGRTGNNLFQYALGRVLSEKHGVDLVMDGSWFNAGGWRQVSCLRRLPIKARLVRRMSLGARALRKLTGRHYWEYRGVPVLREPMGQQAFDARFLDAPAECMLFGYFQTPLYFAGIGELLRQELATDVLAWPTEVRDLAAEMASVPSVAVHVRRTDFTWLPGFDVCDTGYYGRAMDEMRVRVPGARFYIFSDDTAWCRERFTGADERVVEMPGAMEDPLVDFHLMGRARHHVIANSSYSWWAAWLAKWPGQVVLCPPQWFSGDVVAPIAEKLCDGWEMVGSGGKAAS